MSDKPLAERLQVKHGRTLAVLNAPAGMGGTIASRPADTSAEDADVVLLFAADRARLDGPLADLLPRLKATAILWVAYPKLTSKLAADLSRDIIHAATPGYGLDTVSQIAVDLDWSALRLKRV
jgi:hypothetical protein